MFRGARLRFFALTLPEVVFPILAWLTLLQAITVAHRTRPHIVGEVFGVSWRAKCFTCDDRVNEWIHRPVAEQRVENAYFTLLYPLVCDALMLSNVEIGEVASAVDRK